MTLFKVLEAWEELARDTRHKACSGEEEGGKNLRSDEEIAAKIFGLKERIGWYFDSSAGEDEDEDEDIDPLTRVLADAMYFIEYHLVRTEHDDTPCRLASGEKLESGMMILSVLQEVADDLYHADTQAAK